MKAFPVRASDGVSSELRIFSLDIASPVVLIFPAMGVPARKYKELALSLNEQGLQAVIAELRGIETSSVIASREQDFGYKDMIEVDFALAMQSVKELFPEQPVFVVGHSLGGQLALLMMARDQSLGNSIPAGLILSASCAINFRGWPFPKNLFILFFTQFGALIASILGYFPGKKLKFGGREAKSVIWDWARSARTGQYIISNSEFNYELALQELHTPLLAINYSDDGFSPQTATELLLEKVPNADISRLTLTKKELSAKTADHFSWLRHPSAVAIAVNQWIDSVLNKAA